MRIILDPGHYAGYNAGAVKGYFEGNTVWELAGLLKAELEKYGAKVTLTRQDNRKDLSLEARGEMAAGDLFLSLHTNGFTSPSVRGVEAFLSLHRPESRPLCDALGNAVTAVMRADMPGTYYRGSQTRAYSNMRPTWDYYGVIRGAVGNNGEREVKHAILMEHGFHSNPEECAWLMKKANLQRLAEVEADAIAKYFGLSKPLYRVQTGAFSNRENAERLAKELQDKGYQTIVK